MMPDSPSARGSIAIRCDGDEVVGAGHVARCVPLAHALAARGHEPIFIGAYAGLAAWLLERAGLGSAAPQADAPCGVDPVAHAAAIVDSYAIDGAELCALAGLLPIATLAEARRCPSAGVWIDYHLDRAGQAATDRLLPGPAYAPLDPELAGLGRPGSEVRSVLVTLGGSAPVRELAPQIATALRPAFPGARLLVGSGALVAGEDVELLPFPSTLHELIPRIDLAVTAAGLTAYELACAGIPMLAIALAANQARVSDGCRAFGLAAVAAPDAPSIRTALHELRDPERRARMAAAGRATFDGQGAERAAAALLERWRTL